jgi:hypothetical protein
VTVTAIPDAHWHFTVWSGSAVGTQNPLSVTMDGNKSFTATFSLDAYTLEVQTMGGGSVAKSPDQTSYDYGTVVTVTATPSTGWFFGGWSGSAGGALNPLAVTINANKSITAIFLDSAPPVVSTTYPNGGESVQVGTSMTIRWSATDNGGPITTVDLAISRDHGLNFVPLATGVPNSGSYAWTVQAPGTNVDSVHVYSAVIKVSAMDGEGQPGEDASDAEFSIYDLNVETVIARFEAVAADEGITVRWQLVTPGLFAGVSLERSDLIAGPWLALDAARRSEGSLTVALDLSAASGRTYWYRLVASARNGTKTIFGPVSATAGLSAGVSGLASVSPNPAAGPLRVEFTVARPAPVRLSLMDLQGREVAVLAQGAYPSGRYQAVWDRVGSHGSVPAGVYFVRYRVADLKFTKRVVITR